MSDSLTISNSEDEWRLFFVLHNLSIKKPIGNKYVAVVPPSDQRIATLTNKYVDLKYLISNFVDQFNRRVTPCVLIARNDSPSAIFQSDALVSFRNIIAICYIVESWQDYLNRGWCLYSPGYSNYFDIYPIVPSKDYKHFLTISPAVHGLDMPNEFSGQTSPELNGSLHEIHYDSLIFDTLIREWEKRYVRGKLANWKTTVLFRSLQMAYQASAIPMNNRSTIYDYGLSLALWVSAFEVLVRPKSEHADLYKVLNLLGQSRFQSGKLSSKRYSITYKKKRRCQVTAQFSVNIRQSSSFLSYNGGVILSPM